VSWFMAASVPTIVAMIVVPFLLYKFIKPEVTAMPHAPAEAKRTLAALGPITRDQKVVGVTFLVMVALWALAGTLKIDPTAIAFLGLGVLLAAGVLTASDIAKEGDVLATFIWFALLFTMSDQLNKLGFMEFLGERLVMRLGGLPVPVAAIVLVVAYVALHYLFVSQTAQVLALFGVFPRGTAAAWAALAIALALVELGPLADLPQALVDISPFAHSPQLPGGNLDAAPLVLTALAGGLAAAGLAGLRRRDLTS